MRVKLNSNGYTKIYNDGRNVSINGDYLADDEVTEWLLDTANTIEDEFTQVELDQKAINKANALLLAELDSLDKESIRDIREWIAAQPTAPQGLKDREAAAVTARGKIV